MPRVSRNLLFLIWILGIVVTVGWLTFTFASPWAITFPTSTQAVVRLQIIARGQGVDFGTSVYQTPLTSEICGDAGTRPMGFHRGQDQWLHLYWQGLSGGSLLRNYGYQNTSPFEGYLGVDLREFPKIKPVPIHTDLLPEPTSAEQLYVYSGNENGYRRRDVTAFINQDLEQFLKPSVDSQVSTFPNQLDTLLQAPARPAGPKKEEDLESFLAAPKDRGFLITDLSSVKFLGNIVVFLQDKEPTSAAVSQRFSTLNQNPPFACP